MPRRGRSHLADARGRAVAQAIFRRAKVRAAAQGRQLLLRCWVGSAACAAGEGRRGPFPDIADHPEQAISVRWIAIDRARSRVTAAGEMPGERTDPDVGLVSIEGVAPGMDRAKETAAASCFPFPFVRQSQASP